jgi:SAM-dependent methyltransferase
MYIIEHCPACNSLDIRKESAKLAQFVIWKATDEFAYSHKDNNAIICNQCSFLGSQIRLTDEEETRLYKDYRGEEYNNKRLFCEPWYANYINMFDQEKYVNDRKVGINRLIDTHVDIMTINKVLDYGGDTGSHIPDKFIKAKWYVSDISGVPPMPGVLPFDTMTQKMTVDFLMCCHVLEHKSDPDVLIKDIKRFVNSNSWIYIEVPHFDAPQLPGGIFHEHLNAWNMQSMKALLEKHQIDVVDSTLSEIMDGHSLCILA